MPNDYDKIIGAKILAVKHEQGDDGKGDHEGQYGAYSLKILTDKGLLVMEGCEDAGGDLEIVPTDIKSMQEYFALPEKDKINLAKFGVHHMGDVQ